MNKWIVEFSASQHTAHVGEADEIFRRNVIKISEGISTDYVIIGLFLTEADARKYARTFTDDNRKRFGIPVRGE